MDQQVSWARRCVLETVFTLVNQISEREAAAGASHGSGGERQAAKIITMLLQFAEKNPGMARVMVGDALVFENERLQQRMNLFFDKLESTLKQILRASAAQASGELATPSVDSQIRAGALVAFAVGRMQRYTRSGFKRLPTEHLDNSLSLFLG
jgi:TetR/AcrR family transcriptional regulator